MKKFWKDPIIDFRKAIVYVILINLICSWTLLVVCIYL